MKKFNTFLSIVALIILCVISVFAADDYLVYDLTDSTTANTVLAQIGAGNANASITENGILAANAVVEFRFQNILPSGVNAIDYPVMVVEYINATNSATLRMDWRFGNVSGDYLQRDAVLNTTAGTLHEAVGDFKSSIEQSYSTSYAHLVSFYPCLGDGQSVTIHKVLFLKTLEDYTSYRSSHPLVISSAPGLLYNVGKQNAVFGADAKNLVFTYEDDYAIATVKKGVSDGGSADNYVTLKTSLSAASYPWVKLRIRNLSTAQKFEMYFSNNGSTSGMTRALFDITSSDSEFKEYIFNINNASASWTGTISHLRFDFMYKDGTYGNMPTGSQMYIDYIGFFPSEEAARNHVPSAESAIEKPSINSGKASPQWKFRTQSDIDSWGMFGIKTAWVNGLLQFIPVNNDPQIAKSLASDEYFSADEFPYLAYRYSAKTYRDSGQIFYITTETTEEESALSFSITDNSGDWTTSIIDLRDASGGKFTGTCKKVRIDPLDAADADAIIMPDCIGFFRTKTDAVNFLKSTDIEPNYSLPSTFSTLYQKVHIPGGNLYDGYKKEDFMLSSKTPIGTGEDPVVFYTDANANKSVIPLSYTTSGGYTTFESTKPGTYTLGYNRKTYTDVEGHWGEEYINFVSDREIFAGHPDGSFTPDMPLTRAMFITVLGRMHGVDTSKYTGTSYSDVDTDMYYAPYVKWASGKGIMTGISSTEFAPDEPITRAEMAVIIKNYLTTLDRSTHIYTLTPAEFTDLNSCDTATVNAIEEIADLGIVKGVTSGKFAPNSILTRAEAAAVIKRLIMVSLGVNMADTEYTNEYITRDRLRIGAWGFPKEFATPEGFELLYNLGVDFLPEAVPTLDIETRDFTLNYCDLYGIELYMKEYPLSQSDYNKGVDPVEVTSEYIDHPSFAGNYFTDEPGINYMESLIGKMAVDYMEALPNKRPYVNLLPMYANDAQLHYGASASDIEIYDPNPDLYKEYCQTWFDTAEGVDYICVDIYPLRGNGLYEDYCESVNQVAEAARNNNAEFWCYIQCGLYRDTNINDIRWQCYTLLAYGCTGILLFTVEDYIFYPDTVTINQTKYNEFATVMWEMRRLSDTYIQYENLGTFTVNCTSSTPHLQMTNEYTGFTTISQIQSSDPLLVGCFDKKQGSGKAFTLVNMYDPISGKYATAKFKLDASYTVTVHATGDPYTISPDASGYYTITLSNGQGVFITLS